MAVNSAGIRDVAGIRRIHDTKGIQAMPSANCYDVTTWPVGNAA